MSSSPVRAILAGHGDFAKGMISAVQQITGRGDVFFPVSARDLSGPDLEALIRKAVADTGASVVFTDLQAGSCTMGARRMIRDKPEVLLIAGVNLPILLDFVFADQKSPQEAATHALERGKAAIIAAGSGAVK